MQATAEGPRKSSNTNMMMDEVVNANMQIQVQIQYISKCDAHATKEWTRERGKHRYSASVSAHEAVLNKTKKVWELSAGCCNLFLLSFNSAMVCIKL